MPSYDHATNQFIDEVLPAILKERGKSLRTLARSIGLSPSHLSRALRGEEGKRLSHNALRAIAEELDVPPEFFREYRTEVAVEAVRSRVELANSLYDQLKKNGHRL